jgi:hypothetical protein
MRWWVAVTAGRVLAAVEEYAAVRPMAWVLRPPVSVVVTGSSSSCWFTAALYGDGERIGSWSGRCPVRSRCGRLSSCSPRSGWGLSRREG